MRFAVAPRNEEPLAYVVVDHGLEALSAGDVCHELTGMLKSSTVPGVRTDGAFRALGAYLATLKNVRRVEILRYHRLAEAKYERMGREYPLKGTETPSRAAAESRAQILRGCGLSPVMCR